MSICSCGFIFLFSIVFDFEYDRAPLGFAFLFGYFNLCVCSLIYLRSTSHYSCVPLSPFLRNTLAIAQVMSMLRARTIAQGGAAAALAAASV